MFEDVNEEVSLTMKKLRSIVNGLETADNSNLGRSPEVGHKQIADIITKDYYMRRFPKEIREAHQSGAIHIHTLEYFGTRSFCRSWDIRPIFMYGLKPDGGKGATDAGPAQHLDVAILQMNKLLSIATTYYSGGQGLLYGLVFLSPYARGKTYKEIKQAIQMIFFEANQSILSRGGQVCFSSINVTPGVPKILEDVKAVYKGHIGPERYKDFEEEVKLLFKATMEVALEGDMYGRPFNFPKIELAMEPKFLAEEYHDLMLSAFQLAAKTGGIYFDNLLMESKHADTSVSCSQCCAYSFKSDESSDDIFTKRLNFEDDESFQLGGHQVVSINLPRIAYLADHNDKKFMARIYDVMDIALEVFKIKKERVLKQAKNGNLPFLTQKTPKGASFIDIEGAVFELGVVGLNDAVQYHTGSQLHEGDLTFAKTVLCAMQEQCKLMSEFNEMKIVLCRTPAETTAMRFAVCDMMSEHRAKAETVVKGDLNDAIRQIDEEPGQRNLAIYYSNGVSPTVSADISILQRARIESEMWQYLDGGSVTNLYIGEDNPDPEGMMALTINIFQNTNIGYMCYTKDYSMCSNCNNIISGIKDKCPKCGSTELMVFSRITGYVSLAGVMRDGVLESRWNNGKAQELKDRHREVIQ
jgi:ribonucleoside-triphosphate reductase